MIPEAAAKCGMAGLLVAAFPGENGIAETWAQWGLAGLVVGFVLVRDWQREKAMVATAEKRQAEALAEHEWIRNTLMGALERNTQAMNSICGGRRDPKHEGG